MTTTTSEQKPQGKSISPQEIPFTVPQAFNRFITDTGKILPRRITRLSAKQQRTVTRTIKRGRNMLTMK